MIYNGIFGNVKTVCVVGLKSIVDDSSIFPRDLYKAGSLLNLLDNSKGHIIILDAADASAFKLALVAL